MQSRSGRPDDVDGVPDMWEAPPTGEGLAEVRIIAANPGVAQRVAPLLRQVFPCEEPRSYPRYVFRGPARGPLASGPGMTVTPCRRHDLGGGVGAP